MRARWLLGLLGLVWLLSACAGMQSAGAQRAYTVKSGDTLYLVAWKYKLDYRDLARWNRLGAPYTIYAGQRLVIDPPPSDALNQIAASQRQQYQVQAGDTVYSIARAHQISVTDLVALNHLNASYTIYPNQILKLRPSATKPAPSPKATPKTANATKPKASPSTPAPIAQKDSAAPRFVWPTAGKYQTARCDVGTQPECGILISGTLGQDVRAAAAGTVKYVGMGLPNLGKMVILQHNDTYISAYFHNATLLVKDNEVVAQGQKIATMGKRLGKASMLQFEIRKNGASVDPLLYLPKR